MTTSKNFNRNLIERFLKSNFAFFNDYLEAVENVDVQKICPCCSQPLKSKENEANE